MVGKTIVFVLGIYGLILAFTGDSGWSVVFVITALLVGGTSLMALELAAMLHRKGRRLMAGLLCTLISSIGGFVLSISFDFGSFFVGVVFGAMLYGIFFMVEAAVLRMTNRGRSMINAVMVMPIVLTALLMGAEWLRIS
ncbi:hypothetical protein B0H94_10212 [Salsuginibacillus halophilus]|uniref:Uncharacterized protein n=1 Tax=Salsuginibacillus halophilus TaxID=517424 RepID=A0A2P8HX12_9BACI|nr:hypothetical protein [Salsuginibacillus halophilus]PSL50738.1 hypothetical protein B0H94_10212 [Salsuginibacillus halophilus]